MGLLLSCWLIVGAILIPNAYGRWTRLSYFVHPSFLLFCELYLVSKHLFRNLVFLLLLPFRLALWIVVSVFALIRTRTSALISLLVRVIELSVDSGEDREEEFFETVPAEDLSRSVALWSPRPSAPPYGRFPPEEEEEFFPAQSGDDYLDRPRNHGGMVRGKRKRDDAAIDRQGSIDLPTIPRLESGGATASPRLDRTTLPGLEPGGATASPRLDRTTLPGLEPGGATASPRLNRTTPPGLEPGGAAASPRQNRTTVPGLEPGGATVSPRLDRTTLPVLPTPSDLIGDAVRRPVRAVEERETPELIDSPASSLKVIRRRRTKSRPAVEREREEAEPVEIPAAPPKQQRDAVHEEYEKRMAWFDRVSKERNGEATELLRVLLPNPSFHAEDDIPRLQGTPYHGLLKTMETSLEMVYVGQTCLSWEALHRQYVKAKALISGDGDGVPWEPTVAKFKQFGEVLERYRENELMESSRKWNYSRWRLSPVKPLQVPEISGNERRRDGTAATREVVAVVERAIDIFWDFIQFDDHRRRVGRIRRLLWEDPRAEDPGDFYLLEHLKQVFRQAERRMEKLVEKRGKWWKAMSFSQAAANRWLSPQEYFAAIEVKLVGRVLEMQVVSSQQLLWCEQKLQRLEIRSSRVVRRSPQDDDLLFPYS